MTDYYWLNEDSRVFLDRGYLKGEAPEERIKAIADTAQGYLGIEGFSDKFASYMKQGFYSLLGVVEKKLILVESHLEQFILWSYLIK